MSCRHFTGFFPRAHTLSGPRRCSQGLTFGLKNACLIEEEKGQRNGRTVLEPLQFGLCIWAIHLGHINKYTWSPVVRSTVPQITTIYFAINLQWCNMCMDKMEWKWTATKTKREKKYCAELHQCPQCNYLKLYFIFHFCLETITKQINQEKKITCSILFVY